MENSFQFVLGRQVLPLDIHAIAADAEGHLLKVTWDGPVRFRFDYDGWLVEAVLIEDATTRLELSADLGAMPFTAEARSERASLQAVVDAGNGHLGGLFLVTRDRRIRLSLAGVVDGPLTAVGLVATVARLLLPATPYLELLAVFLRTGRGGAWRRPRR